MEIRGNKAVEDAAIQWIMELERSVGREPTDTRHAGKPADVESPPRLIEVKAFGASNRGYDLWLEVRQVEEAKRNPNFYVYVVENVRQGDPDKFTLKILGEGLLARLLERAKEQRYYTVPWPVAAYDSAPTALEPNELSDTVEDPASTPGPDSGTELLPERAEVEVVEFREGDEPYLRWVREHARGFVLNMHKHPKPDYLQLHDATCKWIVRKQDPGAYTERQYIKICSTSRKALEEWAKDATGGTVTDKCSCPPL